MSIAKEQQRSAASSAGKGFDAAGFYGALRDTAEARKVTWKQVSTATGVSATTLTRMARGRKPDAASLAALSAWAGLNPVDFVATKGKPSKAEPLAAVTTYFRADPNLTAEGIEAITAMIRAAYSQLRTDAKAK